MKKKLKKDKVDAKPDIHVMNGGAPPTSIADEARPLKRTSSAIDSSTSKGEKSKDGGGKGLEDLVPLKKVKKERIDETKRKREDGAVSDLSMEKRDKKEKKKEKREKELKGGGVGSPGSTISTDSRGSATRPAAIPRPVPDVSRMGPPSIAPNGSSAPPVPRPLPVVNKLAGPPLANSRSGADALFIKKKKVSRRLVLVEMIC